MIEIIGTGNISEKEPEWRSLPKNVRQIGENREKRKIYIEDYVVTYLGRLARPNQAYARGAILFGKMYETEEGPAIFINGAVEAPNLELDMDETVFNDRIWDEILQKGEEYFPGQEVMGWFLSRMGFSVEMNQKIINTHLKNFPGGQKVLYMIDSLEKEDAVYICENQQMKRQKGYYIYYEKNSAMQEYMIASDNSHKKSSEESNGRSEIRRDRKVVNGYRRMSQYSRQNKKQDNRIRVIRAACMVLILIMGVYIFGQLKQRWGNDAMEGYVVETFQAIKNVFGTGQSQVQEETWTGDGQISDGNQNIKDGQSSDNQNADESKQNEDDTNAEGQITSDKNTSGSNTNGDENQVGPVEAEDLTGIEDDTQETIGQQKPLYYTVQKGDTLAKISRKMYSTDKYTQQIAWANDLSDANEIYEGQRLLIPAVEQ